MLDEDVFDRDFAELTKAQLLEVAEQLRAQLRELRPGEGETTADANTNAEEGREQFFAEIEKLPVGISIWDKEDRHVFRNAKSKELNTLANAKLGETYEEVIRRLAYSGRVAEAIGHEEAFVKIRLEQHRNGETFEYKSGGRWLEMSHYPLEDGRTIAFLQDISTKKANATALREREAELLTAHAETKAILDNIVEGVITYDSDGTIQSFSESASRLLGFTRDELVGASMTEFMPDDVAARFRDFLRIYQADGEVPALEAALESVNRRKDGATFPVEVNVATYEVEGARRFLNTIRDITEKKLREEKLLEEQRRLRSILENMPVMMNAFDEDYNCVMWNRECEEVTGYRAEEVLGKRALEIVIPDSAYRKRMLKIGQMRGDHRAWVWRFKSKDGRDLDISWSNISREFPVPGWERWGIGVDVTERIRAESDARQQGERLQALLDCLHEGLVIADATGIIIDVNPAAIRVFGYSREELVGANLKTLMPQATASAHDGYLADYLKSGNRNIIGVGRRLTAKHKQGREFPIHLFVEEFEWQGHTYFVGAVEDLSEKEDLESRQRQSEKLAALGRMASGIAHDFNNLLLPIITLTELVNEDQQPKSKTAQRLGIVLEAAERGTQIVEKFLAFSRDTPLAIERLDLKELIDEVLELLRSSTPGNVSIRTRVNSVPPILGNASEMHELIVNLARNAVDAIGENPGVVQIEVDRVSADDERMPKFLEEGSRVRLSVSDTGTGMSLEVQDRIFDPFYSTKPVGGGTGLGLSVVHGIVERMGGFVDVSSSPGEGTKMQVYLPIAPTH